MKPLSAAVKPRTSTFDPQRRDTVLDLADLIEGRIEPTLFFTENFITEGMGESLQRADRPYSP